MGENMSCAGSASVNVLPFAMRALLTQCTPMVGIHPNTGSKPAACAALVDARDRVAALTSSIWASADGEGCCAPALATQKASASTAVSHGRITVSVGDDATVLERPACNNESRIGI